MKTLYVAIDWGGTRMKLGIFHNESLISKHNISAKELSNPDKFFKFLREYLTKVVAKHGCTYSSIQSAGIGIPGLLNVTDGFIYYLPNIKGWENFEFKKKFEKELGFSVVMDNDANVAGLCEFKRGAAIGYDRGIVFTLGTGLGSGLFLDGRMFAGDCSSAEAGHMPLSLNGGKKCGCSANGCAETFVNIKSLVEKAKKMIKKEKSLLSKIDDITPKDMFDAAKKGDKVALKCWEELGEALGIFSAGLVNLLDLQVIVVGGGVAGAYKFFSKSMQDTLKKRAMHPLGENVRIKKAKFSNEAGLYGAYELIKEIENRKRILYKYHDLVNKKNAAVVRMRR